ncbi:MAG: GNAT family N-acetyltransferase [Pseudomonadota bacterium]
MNLEWKWYAWQELSPDALHAFLKLRSDIFVVEQNCVFSDMDGRDPACEHLCGFEGEALVAYLRLVPPGLKSDIPALGRLVVVKEQRRKGHSRKAIELGLARCAERYPRLPVRAQAQAHLAPFYQTLGFTPSSAQYMEDGIPHIDMQWQSS